MTAPKKARPAHPKAATAKAGKDAATNPAGQAKRAEMAEALVARRVAEKAAAEAEAHAETQRVAGERERQEAQALAAEEAAKQAEAERAAAELEREQANALAAKAAAQAETAALAAAEAEAASAAAPRVWAFAWPVTGEPTAAIAACGAVGLSLCDASREWIGWAHARALRRAGALTALARVQSPSALLTLSGELAREDVTQLLETSGRVRAIASRAVGLMS
jgi:hypothetical protein